jgi:hypothetical protein
MALNRIRSSKLSRDPNFVKKVSRSDENSQIESLARAQPRLAMSRAGTMPHEYKRHGTTTPSAALNMFDGTVIGECMTRRRHREFLRVLKLIDKNTRPALIVDNYSMQKTAALGRWLKSHKRFHLHFFPTSASWLNMVKRFFAEITCKRIRSGVLKSVRELEAAIVVYLKHHNSEPKPFTWTASVGEILEELGRGKQALEIGPLGTSWSSF